MPDSANSPVDNTLLARFRPLFSIAVEHLYFADKSCAGLRLEPYAQSAQLMQKAGCLWRATPGGISVYADVSRKDLLRACFAEATPAFTLGFQGYADDPLFDNYTGGYARNAALALAFNSANVVDEGGRLRLHAGETVSEADQGSAQGAQLPPWRRFGPAAAKFDVAIKVDVDALDAVNEEFRDGPAGKNYYLRFAARETFWQYNVVCERTSGQVSVIDSADKARFEDGGVKKFADGRAAQLLRSQQAIALQEHSQQRFELRVQDDGRERVIIKRLPVASAGQFNLEEHQGAQRWVSEIYVNC